MQYITLDFAGCKYVRELYDVIRDGFRFEEYCDDNLETLYYRLKYYDDGHIYIKGLDKLPKDLREYLEKILDVFDDVHEENPNIVFEMEIVLDFTGCKYVLELYDVIRDGFRFAEYCGNNLSAVWDWLRYYDEIDRHIYIKGLDKLPKDLREYFEKILDVFDKVHKENPTMTFEIVS